MQHFLYIDSKEEIGQSGGGERVAEDLNFLEMGKKQSSFKDIRVPPALPKLPCSVLEGSNSLSLC